MLPIWPHLTTSQHDSIIMRHRSRQHIIDFKSNHHQIHFLKTHVWVLGEELLVKIRLLLIVDILKEGLVLCILKISINHPLSLLLLIFLQNLKLLEITFFCKHLRGLMLESQIYLRSIFGINRNFLFKEFLLPLVVFEISVLAFLLFQESWKFHPLLDAKVKEIDSKIGPHWWYVKPSYFGPNTYLTYINIREDSQPHKKVLNYKSAYFIEYLPVIGYWNAIWPKMGNVHNHSHRKV